MEEDGGGLEHSDSGSGGIAETDQTVVIDDWHGSNLDDQ